MAGGYLLPFDRLARASRSIFFRIGLRISLIISAIGLLASAETIRADSITSTANRMGEVSGLGICFSTMGFNVCDGGTHQFEIVAKVADSKIASATEKAANLAGCVAVVDAYHAAASDPRLAWLVGLSVGDVGRSTYRALSALKEHHRVVLLLRQAVAIKDSLEAGFESDFGVALFAPRTPLNVRTGSEAEVCNRLGILAVGARYLFSNRPPDVSRSSASDFTIINLVPCLVFVPAFLAPPMPCDASTLWSVAAHYPDVRGLAFRAWNELAKQFSGSPLRSLFPGKPARPFLSFWPKLITDKDKHQGADFAKTRLVGVLANALSGRIRTKSLDDFIQPLTFADLLGLHDRPSPAINQCRHCSKSFSVANVTLLHTRGLRACKEVPHVQCV